MDKPDVESIEGLSPAIAIDQKSVSHNPRSTVGTVTEIHDYLRLLFARLGLPHCPQCGKPVQQQTIPQMIAAKPVAAKPAAAKVKAAAAKPVPPVTPADVLNTIPQKSGD
jgi:excinuclease ABC subunit A